MRSEQVNSPLQKSLSIPLPGDDAYDDEYDDMRLQHSYSDNEEIEEKKEAKHNIKSKNEIATYPKPILFSSIWSVSMDESIEELIDKAVKKLMDDDIWQNEKTLPLIYGDGEDYYQIIEEIYNKLNGKFWKNEWKKIYKSRCERQQISHYDEELLDKNKRNWLQKCCNCCYPKEDILDNDNKENELPSNEEEVLLSHSFNNNDNRENHKFCKSDKLLKQWSLNTVDQQKYFWCFILALSTTIKYMDFQLQHQIITNNDKQRQTGRHKNGFIVDNDITSHWDGFLVSPLHGTGTDMQKYNNKDRKHQKQETRLSPIISLKESQCNSDHDESSDDGSNIIKHTASDIIPGIKYKCCCNEEVINDNKEKSQLKIKNDKYTNPNFEICKDCVNLLHLAEYTRKFILEYENNEVVDDTWPWYENSMHDKPKYMKLYRNKCEQYGLLSMNPLDIIRPLLKKQDRGESERHSSWKKGRVERAYLKYKAIDNIDDIAHIRHRRKFAAKYLLGPAQVLSNIEHIKRRLDKLTFDSMESIATTPSDINITNSSPIFKGFKAQIANIGNAIGGTMAIPTLSTFFPTQQRSIAIGDGSEQSNKLRDEMAYILMPQNVTLRDIWKQWMCRLVEVLTNGEEDVYDETHHIDDAFNALYPHSDDIINHLNELQHNDKLPSYYKEFIETFRMIPHWYLPNKHDKILLQFAFIYGIQTKQYLNELGDEQCNKYERFLGSSYKQFEAFCGRSNNVLNRLRYLTYILRHYIVAPDDNNKSKMLKGFVSKDSDKEKEKHLKQKQVTFSNVYRKEKKKKKCTTECKFNLVFLNDFQASLHEGSYIDKDEYHKRRQSKSNRDLRSWKESQSLSFSATSLSRMVSIKNSMNKTIVRDIHKELQDVLQLYDLVHYGPMLCKHLIRQLKFKQRNGLYVAIGILLQEIPTIMSIELLQQYSQELRHGEPVIISWICKNVLHPSPFKASTALILSHYLRMNAEADLARHSEWIQVSNELQEIASDSLNAIENLFALALIVTIPCSIDNKRQRNAIMTALEYRCIKFVNNEKLNEIVDFMWHDVEFLNPEQVYKYLDYSDQLILLIMSSAKFYFTPMGLQWTTNILFILYLIYIAYFVVQQIYPYDDLTVYEGFMWIFNLGYVLYETQEMIDNGVATYFAFKTNGYLNFFDFAISVLWIAIFALRVYSVPAPTISSHDDPLTITYMILWCIQCILLSIRLLTLFKGSKNLGVFLRMLQLMVFDVFNFAIVLTVIFCGFLFGIWFLVGNDYVDSDVSQPLDDMKGTALYLFQTLVGQQDWEVIQIDSDHNMGYIRSDILTAIIIIFTIIGAILLLNLLIALMATTYDEVKEISKSERAFVKAQEASDLLHRGRFIAPPVNLIVFVFATFFITVFVLIPGFITSKWNPYRYISYANPLRYNAFAKDSMIGENIRRRTRHNNNNKDKIHEFEVLKKEKRWWWVFQHRFCRYCYCCITNEDNTSIDYYMNVLKREYNVEIEPTDKDALIRQCVGLYFCPCCHRNFKIEDLYTAFQVSLDFWSFYVFLFVVLPPIAILLCFPALLEKCVTKRDERRELTAEQLAELNIQYSREYNIRDDEFVNEFVG